jgi:hypothetical protein
MEDHNEYSGRIITNAVVFAILFCAKIKQSGEKTSEARAMPATRLGARMGAGFRAQASLIRKGRGLPAP